MLHALGLSNRISRVSLQKVSAGQQERRENWGLGLTLFPEVG